MERKFVKWAFCLIFVLSIFGAHPGIAGQQRLSYVEDSDSLSRMVKTAGLLSFACTFVPLCTGIYLATQPHGDESTVAPLLVLSGAISGPAIIITNE